MNRDEIRGKISALLGDLIDQDDLVLTDESSAKDYEDWDSITQVRLMIGLERQFGFQFAISEASSLKNVGALVDIIESRMQKDA